MTEKVHPQHRKLTVLSRRSGNGVIVTLRVTAEVCDEVSDEDDDDTYLDAQALLGTTCIRAILAAKAGH